MKKKESNAHEDHEMKMRKRMSERLMESHERESAKKAPGKKYAAMKEREEDMEQDMDNHPRRKPADIAQSLAKGMRSKKVLKVIPQKKKGIK